MISGALSKLYTAFIEWRSRGTIRFAPGALAEWGSVVSASRGGSITIGRNTKIRRGAMVQSFGGDVTIGADCTLQSYSMLYGGGPLKIGSGVRVATHSVIVASSHNFEDPDAPILAQGVAYQGIIIGDDVWIGANTTITDGSHIAQGGVIGAGAVVRGKTEPFSVYAGVPAKLIRKRGSRILDVGGAGVERVAARGG